MRIRRQLNVERLEQRCVLSGITLLTHGFGGNTGGWVAEMAQAMAERHAVEQPLYTVVVTDPGHDGGPLSVESGSPSGPLPTHADTGDPEIMVLLDWSDVAGSFSFTPYYRSTVDVAEAVAEALTSLGSCQDFLQPQSTCHYI